MAVAVYAVPGVVGLITVLPGGDYVLDATSGGFSGSGITTLQPGFVTALHASAGTPTAWPMDFSNGFALPNSTGVPLPGTSTQTSASGMIVITESGSGSTAMYATGGGTTKLIAASNGVWVQDPGATPSPGHACIRPVGGAYIISNNEGSTVTFYIDQHKTRNFE